MLELVAEGDVPPDQQRSVRLTLEEVVGEFQPILRSGLPVRPETAGEYLPYFPIVLAYAKATDHLARVIGLDVVVTGILNDLPHNDDGEGLRILFALNPAHRSWNLSQRQANAAVELGCSTDHLRKHRQSKLLADFAYEFVRRNERFKISPSRRVFLDEVPDAGAFDPTEDLELVEYQARCTAELFALRADLIAIRRLGPIAPTATTEFVHSSLGHYLALQRLVRAALDQYGIGVRPDNPDSGIPAIETLLGGKGPFREDELVQLVGMSLKDPDCQLPEGLTEKWREWATTGI